MQCRSDHQRERQERLIRKYFNGHAVLRKFCPGQYRICQRSPSCHGTCPGILHTDSMTPQRGLIYTRWWNQSVVARVVSELQSPK